MGRKGRNNFRYNNNRRRGYGGKGGGRDDGGGGGGGATTEETEEGSDPQPDEPGADQLESSATSSFGSSTPRRGNSSSASSLSSSSLSSSSLSSRHNSDGWDRRDGRGRNELHRYLAEYKDLSLQSHSSLGSLLLSFGSWGGGWRDANPTRAGFFSSSSPQRMVGGVALPELTQSVLQGPCLPFPQTLTSKQRRIVHDICTELDLFHCTIDTNITNDPEEKAEGQGDPRHDDKKDSDNNASGRTVFVSPYADGFESLLLNTRDQGVAGTATAPTNEASVIVPAYRFVPWYSKYRMTTRDREEKRSLNHGAKGRNQDGWNDASGDDVDNDDVDGWRDRTHLVEALWDQPSECLRSGRDVMDFCALEHETLESFGQQAKPRKNKQQMSQSSDNNVPWMLVNTPELLRECVDELLTAHEVGFDVEAHNKSKSCQLTCLLQIKAGDTGKEYVIDPLAPKMWDRMRWLRPVFEDPRIVKIGHSIGGLDVKCLHRDFGIWVVNAFDTYEAARTLLQMDNASRAAGYGSSSHGNSNDNNNGLGLTALCQRYGAQHGSHHRHLKDLYQRCDWRARPLTSPMLEYARLDIRHLISLRVLLMRDLTRAELYDKRLDQLRQESRLVAEALEAVARMEDAYEHVHAAAALQHQPGGTEAPASTPFEPPTIDPLCDDETFKTSHQRETFSAKQSTRSVGDAGYFTAASSLSLSDDDDDNGYGDVLNGMPRKRVVLSPAVVASTDTLRLQPRLMQVLSISQERCLSVWSHSKHPPNQSNKFEKSLLDLWFCQQKDRDDWDDSNIQLYLALVEWRSRVADELGCCEDFVVDLEFLVHVAWRKPTSTWSLRRVSWTLPDVLLDFDNYRSQLLAIVKKHKGDATDDDGIIFYRTVKARYRRSKALVATTLVACAAAVIMTASRRVKLR